MATGKIDAVFNCLGTTDVDSDRLSMSANGAAEGCVLYACTKLEPDSSIRSKVIKLSQHFEIWSYDPGHVDFGVVLWPHVGWVRLLCVFQI